MRLTEGQAKALADALVSAIPSHEELRQVVRYGLDQPVEVLALGRNLQEVVSKLVEAVELQPDGVARLVVAAREARPAHPGLIAVAQELCLAPAVPDLWEQESGLEQAVDPLSTLVDLPVWLSRAGRLEVQVCLIEVDGKPKGTGFLIGPDVVITNYHVVETVITGSAAAANMTLVFDHKQSLDGTVVNAGVRYGLAAPDWQIDTSPYHPAERGNGANITPALSQLDYAFLRTAQEPGRDPVGGILGPPRGWIVPLGEDYAFTAGDVLYVIQHPLGAPLKIAAGTVIGINANHTRVTYRPTTDKGSSGSPVFNRNWDLVALHHSGSKAHNQGIPIAAIRRLMIERGHGDIFDSPLPAYASASVPSLDQTPPNDWEGQTPGLVKASSDDAPAELTPAQREELDEALRSAFNRPRMERLLVYRLGTSLADVAPGHATYLEEVLAVIEWALSEGKVRQLVAEALDMNPGNPKLNAWAQRNMPSDENT